MCIRDRKTVARIDNAEYLDEEYKTFFKNMGISSLIFPEILAARDIIEGIKHSWVRQWWDCLLYTSAIIRMGCFDRVETNGGGFEQVNLLFGENPNNACLLYTSKSTGPACKAG